MNSAVTGKTAVVTGAAHGIGAAYARRLFDLGACVVVADIDLDGAQLVAKSLDSSGARASAIRVDVTDEQSTTEFADQLRETLGWNALHILVNNAGLYRGLTPTSLEALDMRLWRRVIDVNLSGPLMMTKPLISMLRAAQGASVVNQSSAGAYLVPSGSVAYCVSKAALITLTQGMARELGPDGIRVNAIAPGVTMTEATKEKFDATREAAAASATALRRVGRPEDLCGALEFLVTDLSQWMTGQTVVVDGGRTMLG